MSTFKHFSHRWVLVDETGRSRFRTSYPSSEQASRFALPGETPRKMRVIHRGGPFSDVLESCEEAF